MQLILTDSMEIYLQLLHLQICIPSLSDFASDPCKIYHVTLKSNTIHLLYSHTTTSSLAQSSNFNIGVRCSDISKSYCFLSVVIHTNLTYATTIVLYFYQTYNV